MIVPIESIEGVELDLQDGSSIGRARVLDASASSLLSWDRFVRLKASAEAIKKLVSSPAKLLDAGGYDGALALFLPNYQIDVIDPATTGGSVLNIPALDRSYDAIVAVDVLEHIEPNSRASALAEFARVAASHIVLNYPCRDSKEAQELALKLTNNALIVDHVRWELPDSDWVLSELAKFGFKGSIVPHTSIAIWLGQYLTLNLMVEAAKDLNRHLIANYADEPCSRSLYHLVFCGRN